MGQTELPNPAEEHTAFQVIQHEIVLLLVIAIAAVPLYFFTRKMAATNRHRNARIALDLYRRAQRQLAGKESEQAIDSLRQAVTNDRNNTQFAFALAQTLAAAHHDDEARLALLRLRDATPENPEINLELARLSARQGDVAQATLYYHHALYGFWSGDRIEQRRKTVRVELIRLLLEKKEHSRALAELLVMSAGAPRTANEQLDLARLFTEAGDLPRAREHFVLAADAEPQNFDALRGAGAAAFQSGDYRTAAQYLERALGQRKDAADVAELLETATLVDSRDPLKPRLLRSERARRLRLALDQTERRLRECIDNEKVAGAYLPSRLEPFQNEVETMRTMITPENLLTDPDLLHEAAELAFHIEEMTSQTCGAPHRFDRALLLMGRRYAGGSQ